MPDVVAGPALTGGHPVTGADAAPGGADASASARTAGAYPQLIGAVTADHPAPDPDFTFSDLRALDGCSRPIVRPHLTDRAAGLAQLH